MMKGSTPGRRGSVLMGLLAVWILGAPTLLGAQTRPSVDNLYMITYKGAAVTVDADLSDWADAQWRFLSVDHPHYGILDTDGVAGTGIPSNPEDASGWFAMKMDDEYIYFAARVRDGGTALIATDASAAQTNLFDHLGVYLGLYDMGDALQTTPHTEELTAQAGFGLKDPVSNQTLNPGGTYRIAPAYDNTGTTLGPDYYLAVRAKPYGPGESPETWSYGYVGAAVANTEAATAAWSDQKGYNLEWKVPFASLAGKLGSGDYANFEWPSFTPEHGAIIAFDADLGDADAATPEDTKILRIGTGVDLDTYSARFGGRAVIVDVTVDANTSPRWTYPVDYKPVQEMLIDGDLTDWEDAAFSGLSMDIPNWVEVQGKPEPNTLSGFFGMKLDDENAYFAIRVRDEGTPMIETFATSNLAFNYDHLSVYLGLYDIGDVPSNPHVEGPGEFEIYNLKFVGTDSARTDTIDANRTYRIKPGTDNTTTTRGADYQLLIRSLPYGEEPVEPEQYNGAYVDTTIYKGSLAAAVLTEDEKGYIMEWQLPLTSLSGVISKGTAPYRGIEWPRFMPEDGVTISFDADITDRDDSDGARGQNRFLRLGDQPSLWRDSKSFRMRGLLIQTDGVTNTSNETADLREIPSEIHLGQNYPNPFNPTTTIDFALPASQPVLLEVYDLLGKRVAVLADGVHSAGTHSVHFDAGTLGSGMYLYRLTTPSTSMTKRLTLIK